MQCACGASTQHSSQSVACRRFAAWVQMRGQGLGAGVRESQGGNLEGVFLAGG